MGPAADILSVVARRFGRGTRRAHGHKPAAPASHMMRRPPPLTPGL